MSNDQADRPFHAEWGARAPDGARNLFRVLLAAMALISLPQPVAAQAPQPAPAAETVLPAGTPASIQVARSLDSQIIRRGDTFPIRLGSPIKIGDQIVIPAGTPGVGEVIHAAPAADGEPGEISIAARYLTFEGRRIPLKGFRINRRGLQSHDAEAKFSALGVLHTMIGYAAEITQGERQPAELAEPFALGRDLGPAPTPRIPARQVEPLPAGFPHPPPGLAQIIFFRPLDPYGTQWRTTVYLGEVRDKKAEYAYLGNGTSIAFHVQPGAAVFSVSGGGMEQVRLEMEPGETYYIGISSPAGRGGSPMEDLYPATVEDFINFGPKPFKPIKKKKK